MLLEITLTAKGYRVIEAASGREGIALAASVQPECILLDLSLPDLDGQEVIKKLREWYENPVIILSVRNSEDDIVRALESGASDYVIKPFRTAELIARIRVAVRQNRRNAVAQIRTFKSLSIDLESRIVRKENEVIRLTPTEYSLLALFVRNEGRVMTHQYILKEIWGMGYVEQTQYLRVFVAQLRKKIGENPLKPVLLVTESGIGYRFGD